MSSIEMTVGLPILLSMRYRNPLPTVDIIIDISGKIVLIRRRNPPYGWALPGGFINYNESAEDAAIREAHEETGLHVEHLAQFHVYSAPGRDPRFHTLTVVFTARASGTPCAASDAQDIGLFARDRLPELAFDHQRILDDYYEKRY
jgi:ADP-ribose pyrophosphatase YjhB (NUDIX family)